MNEFNGTDIVLKFFITNKKKDFFNHFFYIP